MSGLRSWGGQEFVGAPVDSTKPDNRGDGFTQDEIAEIAMNGQIGPIFITGQDAITESPGNVSIDPTKVFVASDVAYSLEEAVSNLNKAIQEEIDKGGAKGKKIAEMDLKASLRVMNDGTTKMVVTSAINPESEKLIAVLGNISNRIGKILDTDLVTQESVIGYHTNIENRYLESKTLDQLDILTRESASQAIGIADAALNQINSMRADIGAVQARFEQAISSLQTSSDNMSAARSRIRDADFAAETAELTRTQILQQAGISVLSQANSLPQSALALLQ